MSNLTREERKRIYEEEKVRLEAQQKLKRANKSKQQGMGCLLIIILIGVIWISDQVSSCGSSKPSAPAKSEIAAAKTTEEESIQLQATIEKSATSFTIKNNDSFEWNNIELTINPVSLSSYEYSLAAWRPGETKTIGMANFLTFSGKRYNPFERSPKTLLISAMTPNGKGLIMVGW
jgi:hypothetical protein